ncbi:hypothetical protein DS745_22285 [Anaerobacillus alkaliphilus]|uniref:Uncharacterized protein n=1 Tax=Anaerobacillus alkaliphilus TaxID=1548597 RepID=A0A4Q0VMT6_9BACI|nr:hypothetical protein [Anaerobacillus alkaliphilus]RXI96443.1 hypothetical protein DS745_22285 [Anaerobacillus alkaliphilus]
MKILMISLSIATLLLGGIVGCGVNEPFTGEDTTNTQEGQVTGQTEFKGGNGQIDQGMITGQRNGSGQVGITDDDGTVQEIIDHLEAIEGVQEVQVLFFQNKP